MRQPILSRYLDAAVLSRIAHRRLEPRGLVMGNLAGAHASPLSGFAVEFAGHREYVPGDDPRHIDWRVYFNRDKYFVKQYELETNLVCHLLVDVSASMRYGQGAEQKLSYASRMAATLGYAIVRQSDKVSLTTFDDHVRGFIAPSNSEGQVVRMTQLLEGVEPVAKTDLGACLNDIASRIGRRGIVMVFSDFLADLAGLEAALQRLRYQQHEVVLFPVLHHDELEFELDGMTRFVGLELPEAILAQPDDLRAAYLDAIRGFLAQFEELAGRNRCEWLVVNTRRPLADVLIDYLNQRSRSRRVTAPGRPRSP